MENDKLRTLLYNAIIWIEDECSDFFANEVDNEYEWFEEAIGKLQAARLSKKEEKMICSENFEKLMLRRKGPAKNV